MNKILLKKNMSKHQTILDIKSSLTNIINNLSNISKLEALDVLDRSEISLIFLEDCEECRLLIATIELLHIDLKKKVNK